MVEEARQRSVAQDKLDAERGATRATTPKASAWMLSTYNRLQVINPDHWLRRWKDDGRQQDLYVELKEAVENRTLPDPRPVMPHTVQARSPHDRSLWEFGRLRKNIVPPNFQPERFTTMVDGRPVQVLCLTHEGARPEEQLPYLATALAPCRPLCIYGLCHALEPGDRRQPGCRHTDVVGAAWHDLIIPYMADPRHPADILFIVAEQDFRIYSEDLKAMELAEDNPALADKINELKDKHVEPNVKAGVLAGREPTPELRDILRTVTAAHRWTTPEAPNGHGDMVWLSWKPGLTPGKHGPYTQEKKDKRNTHPGVGNYLWAISGRGAKKHQNYYRGLLGM